MPGRLLKLGVPTLAKLRCLQVAPRVQFEEIILNFLRPYYIVLDAGCGRLARAPVRGKVQMTVGVDADERISSNEGVDVLVRGDLKRLPFRDKSFDLVMSWMVVEHLDKPQACFEELHRICKNDALVVVATPNLLHYENLIVALTPYGLHKWFGQRVLGYQWDYFPTRYRANTPKKLAKMMRSAGFTTVELRCADSGPAYLHWLTPAYAAGLIYHRLVNRFQELSCLRFTIIGVFRAS